MPDHPLHAALYDPLMGIADRLGLARQRRRLTAGARGRVLEVGGGTGRNLPLYHDVESVVALEPDGAMARRLRDRVTQASVPVEVHEAALEGSGLPDQSFDTVVCSLVLCSVGDQSQALSEIDRLLVGDGTLLFLEHVRAPGVRGALQHGATPIWSRVAAGCHLDRDTVGAIRAAGFTVTDCRRVGVLVNGVAHKRDGGTTSGDRIHTASSQSADGAGRAEGEDRT